MCKCQISLDLKPKHSYSMQTCVNCGLHTDTGYCPDCGQKMDVQKMSMKRVFEEFLSNWMGFDNRLGRTIAGMTLRPGVVINAYLNGNRVQYISPLAFLLIMTAVLILSFDLFGLDVEDFLEQNQSAFQDVTSQGQSAQQVKFQHKVTEFIARNFRFFSTILIPFLAIAIRPFFRKAKFNFVERLVVVMYMSSHAVWLSVIMLGIFAATDVLLNVPFIILSLFYYAFVLTRVFHEKNYFTGLIKTTGSYLWAFVLMLIFILIVSLIIGAGIALFNPELFR